MKKILALVLCFLSIVLLASCGNKTIKKIEIEHETEFGGIYIKKSIDDFNNEGFAFGDSVNISFSNGKKVKDIPYYNGYYVDANEKVLVGYPGYPYIKLAINYGDDIWNIFNLKDSDTATISLNKKEKYLDIQESPDITYYDDRNMYSSDIEFANFREINVGNIKEGILYRSASPCDNKRKRASYTDRLMEQEHIGFILNLADTDAKIQEYINKEDFNSPYFLQLYNDQKLYVSLLESSNVDPIALNMNYTSKEFQEKIASGFRAMLSSDGPYLVHCLEGKDRTGFVCIVLEALLNATYEEIVDDYMKTYENYYGIDINDSRYATIKAKNVDSMLKFICNGADYKKVDLKGYAKTYLLNGGLTEPEINQLIGKLSK